MYYVSITPTYPVAEYTLESSLLDKIIVPKQSNL